MPEIKLGPTLTSPVPVSHDSRTSSLRPTVEEGFMTGNVEGVYGTIIIPAGVAIERGGAPLAG